MSALLAPGLAHAQDPLAPTASEPGSPPADLAGAIRLDSPGGFDLWTYNNCLVADLARGDGTAVWNNSFCGTEPDGNIGLYGWFGDFAAFAAATAEEVACGTAGCAYGARAIRIYLRWGAEPELQLIRAGDQMVMRVSTGLVDLAEATLLFLLREYGAGGTEFPFRDFLGVIDTIGEGECRPVPLGDRTIRSDHEFALLRGSAHIFYVFLFLHEIAHLLQLDGCPAGTGSGDTALADESACDRAALERYARQPEGHNFVPSMVIAPAIALSHYLSAMDIMLGSVAGAPPASFVEQFPAAQWDARAEIMLERWHDLCAPPVSGLNPAVCVDTWNIAYLNLQSALIRTPPLACAIPDRRASSPCDTLCNSALDDCVAVVPNVTPCMDHHVSDCIDECVDEYDLEFQLCRDTACGRGNAGFPYWLDACATDRIRAVRRCRSTWRSCRTDCLLETTDE